MIKNIGASAAHQEPAVKRALITGASSGVGAAFAQVLSQRGYQLVLVGRDQGRLESVAASVGGPAEILLADLTRQIELAHVEAVVSDATTPVDMLVNNAGAGWHGSFAQLDARALAETIDLNVTAVLRLSRAALPLMVARGHGSLINISSTASMYSAPNMAVYAGTKAFVSHWSASLSAELRGTGVGVTCVNPGYVRTDFHARSGQDLDHVEDKEWMSPEEVALRAFMAHLRGAETVTVLPEVPLWRHLQRRGRSALIQRAPWLHDVRRVLKADTFRSPGLRRAPLDPSVRARRPGGPARL